MNHISVKMNSPIEFINVQPLNPLITKCQIKVCYVGDEPNRNGSVITKDVAKDMANSLPGCPIVGFYNESKEDFEEHNRIIDISNGKFEIKDTTRPYGFVPLDAKVWFQKYFDDGKVEREYLMTEGYLWTGQYPECDRVILKGNNQSMELDEKHLKATWAENNNGGPEFFIINEAIISKLCILGEDNEPCFEGANITSIQFSYSEGFEKKLFSMIESMQTEIQKLLQEGGAKQVFERYSVEVGDGLWDALYALANGDKIIEVCVDGEQTFAVLQNSDENFYRVNFSYSDETKEFSSEELIDLTDYSLSEAPQFSEEDIINYEKKKENEDKEDKENNDDSEDNKEDDSDSNDEDEEDDKKKKYSLEEIPEYIELQTKYSDLETQYNELLTEKGNLESQLSTLKEFKAQAERKEKEELIAQFYMLNDEDKKDVIENIDTYSLDEIEAKLSIICVRNKVKFDEPEEEDNNHGDMTFNLNDDNDDDAAMPAWVKAVLEVEKTLK